MKRWLNVHFTVLLPTSHWKSLRILLENGDLLILRVQCVTTKEHVLVSNTCHLKNASPTEFLHYSDWLHFWSETLQFFYILVAFSYSWQTVLQPWRQLHLLSWSSAQMKMKMRVRWQFAAQQKTNHDHLTWERVKSQKREKVVFERMYKLAFNLFLCRPTFMYIFIQSCNRSASVPAVSRIWLK